MIDFTQMQEMKHSGAALIKKMINHSKENNLDYQLALLESKIKPLREELEKGDLEVERKWYVIGMLSALEKEFGCAEEIL